MRCFIEAIASPAIDISNSFRPSAIVLFDNQAPLFFAGFSCHGGSG
jgi:hypothetical protein